MKVTLEVVKFNLVNLPEKNDLCPHCQLLLQMALVRAETQFHSEDVATTSCDAQGCVTRIQEAPGNLK